MIDVIEGDLASDNTRWISSGIIKGRRICMRGVRLSIVQEGTKVLVNPVIYKMRQALEILKESGADDITWSAVDGKWIVTPSAIGTPTGKEGAS